MRNTFAALAACMLAAPAYADDTAQTLTYDLVVNGAVVGSREVSIRYLQPFDERGAESRVIETWTELDARVGGWTAQVKNRSTAHITATHSNFTSSMSINGRVSEVQGHTLHDGRWQMHGVFDQRLREWQLRRTEVDLSSLDLLDPVRSAALAELPHARVLSAETGKIMTGPVTDLGEGVVTVGNESVPVHRWAWSPDEGRFELAWSDDGLLLDWRAEISGQAVHGRLRQLPPARSFGTAATLTGLPEFTEEEL